MRFCPTRLPVGGKGDQGRAIGRQLRRHDRLGAGGRDRQVIDERGTAVNADRRAQGLGRVGRMVVAAFVLTPRVGQHPLAATGLDRERRRRARVES